MTILADFPIAMLAIVLLIPLAHDLIKKKKSTLPIIICCLASILFYPLVNYLSAQYSTLGYALGKTVIFVIFPLIAIAWTEKWSAAEALKKLGVTAKNLPKSAAYGLVAAAITIIVTLLVSGPTAFEVSYRTIMFFEAFTEEFFFRGFLLLYLLTKTNAKVAFATSILGFMLVHPQNLTTLFFFSTFTQAIVLTVIAYKTKNIIGTWIAHGLNRFLVPLIQAFF